MRSKRPLVPAFLNKLDHYLLLNKPVIWTTRAHLVKYYALLFAVVLTFLCFIVPDNPLSDSSSFVWTTLTAVLSFIGIIIWIIFLLRFNVFKRFGENGKLDALKNFLLFFLSIGFIIAPTYIPTAVESIRANKAFGNEEVVNDINSIHIKINQLEYDSLNHNWSKETFIVRDSLEQSLVYRQADEEYNENIKYIDTAALRQKLVQTDSVVRINDSMYNFYFCPKYTFLNELSTDIYTKAKQKTSLDLYRDLIQNFKPVNKQTTETELRQILKKYNYEEYSSFEYSSDDYDNPIQSYYNVIGKRYNLHPANNGLSNLVDKKYRWYTENDSRLRVWFYLSFIISLLIFIFRHTAIKVFFLSLLTCIILLVLSALVLAFSQRNTQSVYGLCIAYYILFFAVGFAGNMSKTRSTIIGIAINIVTFFTFLVPLFCTLFYYEGEDKLYNYQSIYPPEYLETKEMNLLIAEIAGFVLFLILLQPFFKRLYRSWFAKPEE